MTRVPLFFPFLLSLCAFYLHGMFFPKWPLLVLTPLLCLLLLRKSFFSSLWLSFLCGLLVDLTCSDAQFGIYPFSYVLTTSLCYRFKNYFYEERLFSLPIYTILVSFTLSVLIFILMRFPPPQSLYSLTSNFLFPPLLDGIYAFFWFNCPMMLYTALRKAYDH